MAPTQLSEQKLQVRAPALLTLSQGTRSQGVLTGGCVATQLITGNRGFEVVASVDACLVMAGQLLWVGWLVG